MSAKIIAIAVQRGGTGKTTTAAALAQAAAYCGQRVLAIDLDPQGNLSYMMHADTSRAGAFHFLNGVPAAEVIQRTDQGADVIAASWNLSTITTGRGTGADKGKLRPYNHRQPANNGRTAIQRTTGGYGACYSFRG